MACKHTTLCRTGLVGYAEDGYIVDIAEPDVTKFDMRTDDDFWDTHDAHANTAAMGQRRQNEILSGISYNEYGVLADLELRMFFKPSKSLTYDSMHCAAANGFASFEIYLFFDCAEKLCSYRHGHMQAFLAADWRWSVHQRMRFGKQTAELFNDSRATATKNAGSWKGQASEVRR
jgi:hypothetical protein